MTWGGAPGKGSVTPSSQGGDTGSNPVGAAKLFTQVRSTFYDEASRFLQTSLTSLRLPSEPFDLPVIVVTSGLHLAQAADGRQWGELQRELVALSPCGRQVIAPDAGHDVEVDSPQIVTGAILDVLTSTRARQGCPP